MSRTGVVVAIAAAALAVLVTVPADAAKAVTALEPPIKTEAMPFDYMPACSLFTSGVIGTSSQPMWDAIQLGWQGKPRYRLDDTGGTIISEFAPAIPCRETTGSFPIQINWAESRLQGTTATTNTRDRMTMDVVCMSNAGVLSTRSKPAGTDASNNISTSNMSPGQIKWTGGKNTAALKANCANVVSVTLKIYNGASAAPADADYITTMTWRASLWKDGAGAWSPATTVNDLASGVEIPIVCTINTTGADIFAVTVNFWTSLVNWIPCMLIPAGWDRTGQIDAAWQRGAITQMVNAFEDAFPGGIACGEVFNVATTSELGTIAFSTCSMDVLPAWAKAVVSGVIILGIAALAVKRVMWSVGSKG